MNTIHRNIVGALIISKDNKVLLGKQRKGGVYQDTWHIPGGGIDEGETAVQALQRELIEEVGLTVLPKQIRLVDDLGKGQAIKTLKTGETVNVEMTFQVYEVKIDQPSANISIVLGDDLVEFTWANITKIADYKHTPPSITLFQRLGWMK